MTAAERFIDSYRRRMAIEKIDAQRKRRAAAARAQYKTRWVLQVPSGLYDRIAAYNGTRKAVLESAIERAINSEAVT